MERPNIESDLEELCVEVDCIPKKKLPLISRLVAAGAGETFTMLAYSALGFGAYTVKDTAPIEVTFGLVGSGIVGSNLLLLGKKPNLALSAYIGLVIGFLGGVGYYLTP